MARGLRSSSGFLIGSLFFFVLSFVGMGLAPWTSLKNVIPRGGSSPYADAKLRRGREVYIREACWHCHSQFVRPIAGEDARYGPVSEARESGWDVPQLFGTRRIGPDLAREAGRRPDDWQLAHLENPRNVVPKSVMPAYPWLFRPAANDSVAPGANADGEALVAYVQQIGRLKADEIAALAYPRVGRVEGVPASTPESDRRGSLLFERHCLGCHGPEGDGRGRARRFLAPQAENLTAIRMPPEEAYRVLAGGMKGSAMPSWRELSASDLWALAHRVVRFYRGEDSVRAVEHVPAPPVSTPERLAAGRAAFGENCAVCHGERGRGDGAASAAVLPPPPDFARYSPSVRWTFKVVTNGYAPAMPPWAQLPAETRWNLALYVHSLWRSDTAAVAEARP